MKMHKGKHTRLQVQNMQKGKYTKLTSMGGLITYGSKQTKTLETSGIYMISAI